MKLTAGLAVGLPLDARDAAAGLSDPALEGDRSELAGYPAGELEGDPTGALASTLRVRLSGITLTAALCAGLRGAVLAAALRVRLSGVALSGELAVGVPREVTPPPAGVDDSEAIAGGGVTLPLIEEPSLAGVADGDTTAGGAVVLPQIEGGGTAEAESVVA